MKYSYSYWFFGFFLILGIESISAQNSTNMSPQIKTLIAKKRAFNKDVGFGYRVQIFYGLDRRETFSEQARFRALYPRLQTYITYKEPNYYLRVGDFRTRLEAQNLLNELRPNFPTLFIFRQKINAPNLEFGNK